MTKAETAELLALITAFDRRTTGQADIEAWHLVIGDLEPADCAEAVRQHFARSREWLMPVDVRQGVARIYRDRLTALGDVAPDADPDDPQAYLAALRAQRHAVATGKATEAPKSITTGEERERPLAALMAGTPVKSVPRADWRTRRAAVPVPLVEKPPFTAEELDAARRLLDATKSAEEAADV